jgi:hypothetical protein
MTDLFKTLQPVPYQNVPRGFRSFRREHLAGSVRAAMDAAIKDAGGRIETHTLRNNDGGQTTTQELSWYLLPASAVPTADATGGP